MIEPIPTPEPVRVPFQIVRVVDADTLSGEIETRAVLLIPTVGQVTAYIWLPVVVRLLGVDAAERNTALGKQAIEFVQGWVESMPPLWLEHQEKREKYGRLLGAVRGYDNSDLAAELLEKGYGVPYIGGKRT